MITVYNNTFNTSRMEFLKVVSLDGNVTNGETGPAGPDGIKTDQTGLQVDFDTNAPLIPQRCALKNETLIKEKNIVALLDNYSITNQRYSFGQTPQPVYIGTQYFDSSYTVLSGNNYITLQSIFNHVSNPILCWNGTVFVISYALILGENVFYKYSYDGIRFYDCILANEQSNIPSKKIVWNGTVFMGIDGSTPTTGISRDGITWNFVPTSDFLPNASDPHVIIDICVRGNTVFALSGQSVDPTNQGNFYMANNEYLTSFTFISSQLNPICLCTNGTSVFAYFGSGGENTYVIIFNSMQKTLGAIPNALVTNLVWNGKVFFGTVAMPPYAFYSYDGINFTQVEQTALTNVTTIESNLYGFLFDNNYLYSLDYQYLHGLDTDYLTQIETQYPLSTLIKNTELLNTIIFPSNQYTLSVDSPHFTVTSEYAISNYNHSDISEDYACKKTVYNGKVYLALNDNGELRYSVTGKNNWLNITRNFFQNVYDVCTNGDIFIAVCGLKSGPMAYMVTSFDGINWIIYNSFPSSNYVPNCLFYFNSEVYCASHWNYALLPNPTIISKVYPVYEEYLSIHTNQLSTRSSLFVDENIILLGLNVAYSPSNDVNLYYKAGNNDTSIMSPAKCDTVTLMDPISCVTGYNGIYLAGYNTSDIGYILISYDGINWTTAWSTTDVRVNTIEWVGNVFLAGISMTVASSALLYSVDGLTWNFSNLEIFNIYGITWNGKIGDYMYKGAVDIYQPLVITGSGNVIKSYNGLQLDNSGVLPLTLSTCVVWTGDMYVAGGTNLSDSIPRIAYSYDGISWELAESSTILPSIVMCICWNGSVFLAGGSFLTSTSSGISSIAYSYDGINWLSSNNTDLSIVNDICWNGYYFMATGSKPTTSNNIIISFDGITWSLQGTDLFDSLGGQGIIWNGGIALAVGYKKSGDETGSPVAIYQLNDTQTDIPLTNGEWSRKQTETDLDKGISIATNGIITVVVGKRADTAPIIIYTDFNANTWREATLNDTLFDIQDITQVYWDSKKFIAFGATDIGYSYDGQDWYRLPNTLVSNSYRVKPGVCGNPKIGHVRVDSVLIVDNITVNPDTPICSTYEKMTVKF